MFIYSHNENSEGAKALAGALKAKRIKHENSSFVGNSGKVVINWGSRNPPDAVLKSKVLNDPASIGRNANKLEFFKLCAKAGKDAPRIPDWTTDSKKAISWVTEKQTVVARAVLNGSSGEGIHFMTFDKPTSFVEAPLYTLYIKKKDEYRVHFMNGEIIDYQRKALRKEHKPENVDWRIRNLDAGFVFVRDGVKLPSDVEKQAKLVIAVSGLDFGAIDLIFNEKENQAYVLEVNTAPGLQGETVTSYATAFQKHYGKGE
jgi:glutathione synthase/RimK-type ligase-like ATP-grasp enzyme